MEKHICDIEGCKKEAIKLGVDVCSGYKQSSQESGKEKVIYEPFECPIVSKKDMCKKHFTQWCKATYETFYKVKI